VKRPALTRTFGTFATGARRGASANAVGLGVAVDVGEDDDVTAGSRITDDDDDGTGTLVIVAAGAVTASCVWTPLHANTAPKTVKPSKPAPTSIRPIHCHITCRCISPTYRYIVLVSIRNCTACC
jgi:hypothetical protein